MGSAVSSLLGPVGSVVGILGSLFGIGNSLFGGSNSLSVPTFSVPQVQTFQIPQTDLATLQQQIAQNTSLSTAASQAAQEALTAYSQGQLSAAYAGQYQQAYNQAKQQVMQQLAAQGITGGTQYNNAMQNLQSWAANLYSSLLQQQLQTALQSAGLSQEGIKSLESSWTAQSNINAQNNSALLGQSQVANTAAQNTLQDKAAINQIKTNNLTNAMGSLGTAFTGLNSLLGGNTTTNPLPTYSSTNNLLTPTGELNAGVIGSTNNVATNNNGVGATGINSFADLQNTISNIT